MYHELLLTKLKFLGFADFTIEWFKSHLTGRCRRVYISDVLFSNWTSILTGVPHGSVCTDLLYLYNVVNFYFVLCIDCCFLICCDTSLESRSTFVAGLLSLFNEDLSKLEFNSIQFSLRLVIFRNSSIRFTMLGPC